MAVTWIGTDGITKLVPEHLHSEEPFLFYWWYPDKFTAGPAGEARIKFPTYRKDLWETTGACDFPESDIDKLVHASVSPVIQLFLENFKLSDADVNKLLNLKEDGITTGKLLATLKDTSNFEKLTNFYLSMLWMPKKNTVRLGYKSSFISSQILSNIIADLLCN